MRFTLLFILFFTSSIAAEIYHKTIDGIDYSFYTSEKINLAFDKEIQKFHSIFRSEINKLYNEWNVKKPIRYNIFLTENAGIFGHLTGKNWQTAGVYDSEADRFYFQNPVSLTKQGILQKTIRHEICHQMLEKNRRASVKSWLEEGFCEALSGRRKSLHAKETIKIYPTALKFKNFILTKSNSQNKKEQNLAYQAAAEYAAYLLHKLGKHAVFETIANGAAVEKYYPEFYLAIKKNK